MKLHLSVLGLSNLFPNDFLGLVFLPPRIATWRYRRGDRSLSANLSSGDGSVSSNPPSQNIATEPDDSETTIDIPDEIEEVIDQLLQGLRNSDSIVRWSAAKGIGRVTGRLTKDFADDVVGSVLELLSPRESDGAWHGACLALAELGRRGLLLPERLPQVVPLIVKALVYDEPRGYSSVGSHIRDAACYVSWSFSRAYESHILAPFVQEIASALLVVTCFDREINCRRAASAAFQENVGRQGTFPHGIEILTAADFFSVSVRTNAYLNISVFIAQFEEYKIPLINHLLQRKVDHWDTNIRELTSKALHNLTQCAPDYMLSIVLPALFDKANSIDLNSRHGSVLAIGEILHAMSLVISNRKQEISFSENLLEKTKTLIPDFKQKFYFRGLGGELMKLACSTFIEKCSLAGLPFHDSEVIEEWLQLINDCLSYEVLNIRLAACNALPYLMNEYYKNKPERTHEVLKHYMKEAVNTTVEFNRMGHCLALGSLPQFVVLNHSDSIVSTFLQCAQITPHTLKWAESRRDVLKAMSLFTVTMSDRMAKEFTTGNIHNIIFQYIESLNDYTQDKRGDIGAWVREAAISGIHSMVTQCMKYFPEILTSDIINKMLPPIAQQALEKIDRTRALAGKTFYNIIYFEPEIEGISNKKEIREIFVKSDCDNLNWNSALATFPKFVQLVQFERYTSHILVGLICSIGGLTETLVKNASTSFFAYMKSLGQTKGTAEIKRLCDVILEIFRYYEKQDRIAGPMLRFLDKLFDSECMEFLMTEENRPFMTSILRLVQMQIVGCKDIYKLIDGITVLCQLIQIRGQVCEKSLVQLSILLCHRQPYVRRSTSTKLYESLLINGDNSNINPETLDDVMNLLGTTDWEKSVDEIRPIRNELCQLMGIKVPVLKKP